LSILSRRILRRVKKSPGQFIALSVVVMLGVLIYIAMTTAYYNLNRSQSDFYQKTRFADYFFMVVKAPEGVARQLSDVPGVARASGSIRRDLTFIKPEGGRGTLRLATYDLDDETRLNNLQVISGRDFSKNSGQDIEVLLDPAFAKANKLQPGSVFKVIAEGKEVPLTVIGTAASPEFVYLMKDTASWMPDPNEFGLLMMPRDRAQKILNMQGQVNQIAVQLTPGASADEVEKQVQDRLRPYGNLAAYPRDDQLSHSVLKGELQQLKISALYLPLFFFIIAAGIQFMLLGRLIKNERTSIGVFKALGYSNVRIINHYVAYALSISLTGALLGSILGVALASVFSDMYATYFNLPSVIGGLNLNAIVNSVLLSLLVGGVSGVLACLGVIRINPAESMRPKAPQRGRRILLESWAGLWKRLNSGWRMSLRSMLRNRTRFMVTVLGVAFTAVVLVITLFMNDAIDYMLTRHFAMENNYDYLVQLSAPVKESEITGWNQWEEVKKLEPVLELPVALTAVDGSREENDMFYGVNPGQDFLGVFAADDSVLPIPEEGVVMSERVAKKLGLKVGDMVNVETKMNQGAVRKGQLKVVALNQALMGGGSYVSLNTANRLLGESHLFTRILVRVDSSQAERFEKRLQDMTAISSIVSEADERTGWNQMLDSALASIAVMIMFAALLGMAITYNSTYMNFNEKQRELASMRVLGYTRQELTGLLFKETILQAVIGVIIGLPLGRYLGSLYLASATNEYYSLPFIIYPRTYVMSAVGTMVFIVLGFALVLPRLKHIDLVEALKSTD